MAFEAFRFRMVCLASENYSDLIIAILYFDCAFLYHTLYLYYLVHLLKNLLLVGLIRRHHATPAMRA